MFEAAGVHDYRYDVEGDTLTATCEDGCEKGFDEDPLQLTLMPDDSLNAEELEKWRFYGAAVPEVTYYRITEPDIETPLDSKPYNAGSYVLRVTVGEGDRAAKLERFFTIEPHPHEVGGVSTEFMAWEQTDCLPMEGNYFLIQDVVLAESKSITGAVNLCLNGHVIFRNGKTVTAADGGELNFFEAGASAYATAYIPDTDNTLWYNLDGGTLIIGGNGTIPNAAYPWAAQQGSITKLVIGEGVTNLPNFNGSYANLAEISIRSRHFDADIARATAQKTKLTGVTFEETVETVRFSAIRVFSGCTGLKSIIFGPNVKFILAGASNCFADCTALTEVIFAENVTTISLAGRSMFGGCTALTTLSLPSTLKSFFASPSTFTLADKFATISLADGNDYFYVKDNVLYDTVTGQLLLAASTAQTFSGGNATRIAANNTVNVATMLSEEKLDDNIRITLKSNKTGNAYNAENPFFVGEMIRADVTTEDGSPLPNGLFYVWAGLDGEGGEVSNSNSLHVAGFEYVDTYMDDGTDYGGYVNSVAELETIEFRSSPYALYGAGGSGIVIVRLYCPHGYVYSVDKDNGAILHAACTNEEHQACKTAGPLSLTLTKDGLDAAELAAWTDAGAKEPEVKYYKADNLTKALKTAPAEVGSYVVKATVEDTVAMVEFTISDHTHGFTYESPAGAGNTVVATCANEDGNCPLTVPIALTLTAEGGTYDGTARTATLTNLAAFTDATGAGVGSIEYYKATSTDITVKVGAKAIAKPTATTTSFVYTGKEQTYVPVDFDADTMEISGSKQTAVNGTGYTVTVTLKANYVWSTDGDCKFTWVIGKASLTVTAKDKSITYGAAAANDGVEYSGFVNNETAGVLSGTLSYTYGGYTTASPVGTYDIVPGGLTSGNYDITFEKGTLTVTKATITDISVAQSGTLTYNGGAQTAAVTKAAATVNSQTATFEYATAADGTYGTSVPGFTDAGTYTVYYKVTAPNHEDAGGSFKVSIGRKDIAGAAVTLDGSLTYTGEAQTQSVSSVKIDDLDATYAVTNATATDAGSHTLTVTGTGNFTGSTTKAFTIAKADGSVTAPTAKVLTYNGQAQALINAGSSDTGTIRYRLGETGTYSVNIPTAKAAGDYTVYYKVVGDSNHKDVTADSVTVTIGRKTAELQWTTPTNLVYNNKAKAPAAAVKNPESGEKIDTLLDISLFMTVSSYEVTDEDRTLVDMEKQDIGRKKRDEE